MRLVLVTDAGQAVTVVEDIDGYNLDNPIARLFMVGTLVDAAKHAGIDLTVARERAAADVEEVAFCGCTNEELEAGRTCAQMGCPNLCQCGHGRTLHADASCRGTGAELDDPRIPADEPCSCTGFTSED